MLESDGPISEQHGPQCAVAARGSTQENRSKNWIIGDKIII